jgi:tetratricopeptide (TPR) repeat protein
LARALLDNVVPAPDETVRLWYIATSAHGQFFDWHTRLEDHAVELFPKDPTLLLLAGTFHETLASPRIQSLARSLRLPAGVSHGIGPERSELREAEKLFRRAVQAQPAFSEARIRLGRVLFQLGRHEEAARELRQALASLASNASLTASDQSLLRYYGEMFLGAADEARGKSDAARAAYARAAALYPTAPTPRLALGQLALRGDDRAGAMTAVERALRPPSGSQEADEPWWRYHLVQGRGASGWFDELHGSLAAAQ